MKIRSDFVSNSSSSSFLIATNSNYSTRKLIKDISKKCYCDYWDNEDIMNNVIDNNVSLFVGYIKTNENVQDYNKNDPLTGRGFEYLQKILNDNTSSDYLKDKLSYLDESKTVIRIQEPMYNNIIVSKNDMKKILKMNDEELLHYIDGIKDFEDQPRSYIINKDTITITERLIQLGKEFEFYNKNITFEDIKHRIIDEKENIYNFHVTYQGDGCDNDAFRFGNENGYCSDIFNGLSVEFLNSESC